MNVVLRFGLFGKEVNFRGDYLNGWIDDFVLIFLIEFKGDFDYLILVFEGGIMLFGILESEFFFLDFGFGRICFWLGFWLKRC